MQCLQSYNSALDDKIKNNYNKLLELQIDYQQMHNTILKQLLDKMIPINLPIVKYNQTVLNNHLINQSLKPQPPSPPPIGMYS